MNNFIEEFNFFKVKENRETKLSKKIVSRLAFSMVLMSFFPLFFFLTSFKPLYLLSFLMFIVSAMIARHILYFTHNRYYRFINSIYSGSLYTLFDIEKEANFFSVYNDYIVMCIRKDDGISGECALDIYDKMNSKEVKEIVEQEIQKKRQLREAYNLR